MISDSPTPAWDPCEPEAEFKNVIFDYGMLFERGSSLWGRTIPRYG